MAIYYFDISNGSKSSGKVASIRAAYLTRSGAFSDRDDLVFAASDNLPSWAESPEDFWSAADELERKNARVYREATFAIPRELEQADQVKLAQDFARDFAAEHGLAYTLAVHDDDGHNPHAHLMWCERENDGRERTRETWFKRANKSEPGRGGAAKVREMRGRDWVMSVRKDWELAANTALELAGERDRVDCRSYAEQDKDKPEHKQRIPQIHLGVQTLVLERKGIVTSRRQRWMEIEAERAARQRELDARQAAARAQRQREHMEALHSRMEPVRERPAPEPANPFEPDTLESPPPNPFEADTLESTPAFEPTTPEVSSVTHERSNDERDAEGRTARSPGANRADASADREGGKLSGRATPGHRREHAEPQAGHNGPRRAARRPSAAEVAHGDRAGHQRDLEGRPQGVQQGDDAYGRDRNPSAGEISLDPLAPLGGDGVGVRGDVGGGDVESADLDAGVVFDRGAARTDGDALREEAGQAIPGGVVVSDDRTAGDTQREPGLDVSDDEARRRDAELAEYERQLEAMKGQLLEDLAIAQKPIHELANDLKKAREQEAQRKREQQEEARRRVQARRRGDNDHER
jgi:hypothetical protein